MDAPLQTLTFDTALLQRRVARLIPSQLSDRALQSALATARHKGIELLYWISKTLLTPATIAPWGGLFVDQRTTYLRTDLPPWQPLPDIHPYTPGIDTEPLEELAIFCGDLSRFALDPNISQAAREAVYRNWMRNSCNKTYADEVLFTHTQGTFTGVVTLQQQAQRGNISLLAVATTHRQQGIGTKLVNAALRWSQRRGLQAVQVVTQAANTPARQLYESSGFTVETIEYFYHFWL